VQSSSVRLCWMTVIVTLLDMFALDASACRLLQMRQCLKHCRGLNW
jgi:hypothetical protein